MTKPLLNSKQPPSEIRYRVCKEAMETYTLKNTLQFIFVIIIDTFKVSTHLRKEYFLCECLLLLISQLIDYQYIFLTPFSSPSLTLQQPYLYKKKRKKVNMFHFFFGTTKVHKYITTTVLCSKIVHFGLAEIHALQIKL